MTEAIAHWMNDNLSFLPPELIVFIISMIPILELRGGMIIASMYGFNLFKSFALCIVGNVIPIPFILWLITPIFTWMKQRKIFRKMVEKLEKKAMGKSEKIQKASFWGLLLFVGIPLPGTGAWTGSLIAALLNLDKKRSWLASTLGVVLASLIMAVISYGIPALIDLFV